MYFPAIRVRRCLLALLLFPAPAVFCHDTVQPAQPETGAAGGVVAAFDAAVVAGLPADIALPVDVAEPAASDAPSRQRRSAPHLVVQDALNVDVQMPGMPAGRMYRGVYDGQEAAVTRIGDHLDISVPVREGVDVTGFRAGRAAVLREHVRNPVLPVPRRKPAPRPRDESHVMPEPPFLSRSARAIEDPLTFSPRFVVLIHDDLDATPLHIHTVYGAWWLAELATKVLPTERIRMAYMDHVPGVTDMPYGYPEAIHNWKDTVAALSASEGLTIGETYKHKFLLMTRHRPIPGAFGVAFEGGAEAMASTAGRLSIVAHEFGHTLDARHKDAVQRHESWWWCATSMWPGINDIVADCQRYSGENARHIRSYLRHGPDPETLAEFALSPVVD